MNPQSDRNTGEAPEIIPPLPGGGSWRWEDGKWVSNDPVVEAAVAPAVEAPAEPSPTTEE